MGTSYLAGRYKAYNELGVPIANARIYTYLAGTTTQKNVYTSAALTSVSTYTSDGAGGQYLATDARGEAYFWLGTGIYDIVLKTAAGAVIFQDSGVSGEAQLANNLKAIYDPIIRPHYVLHAGATAAQIQEKLDLANSLGFGTVYLSGGEYNLGTTGLVIYQNTKLIGECSQYSNANTRGTRIFYSGSGFAIYGQNILNATLSDFALDCTGATGNAHIGIFMDGVWLSEISGVRIKGSTPAKGYGISLRTNAAPAGGAFGAQHNKITKCECADGIIQLLGTGANDGVTTTVLDTVRGMQYECTSSQATFINATAEGWTIGAGFNFSGAGCVATMISCDIEGAGQVGIGIDSLAEVRELGTVWLGYSGALRVNGAMASFRNYGGAYKYISPLSVGSARPIATYGDANADYITEEFVPIQTSGGAQDGYLRRKRKIGGTNYAQYDGEVDFVIKKTFQTSSTTQYTVGEIKMPSGGGIAVSVFVNGVQAGNTVISSQRTCLASNYAGKPTLLMQPQLTAADPGQISMGVSTDTLYIYWTPSTANASSPEFIVRINGRIVSHTL